jgi:hypothetical protein
VAVALLFDLPEGRRLPPPGVTAGDPCTILSALCIAGAAALSEPVLIPESSFKPNIFKI